MAGLSLKERFRLVKQGFYSTEGREMNGESQVLVTETVLFPMAEKETREPKNRAENSTGEVIVVKQEIHIDETRFARLKKSSRKRSGGIL
jgi:hypothetical protein